MTYAGFLVNNPYFWSAVTGVAVGGAIASISWRSSRSRRPGRARGRKWTISLLFLTGGVAAATLGVILPPRLAIISIGCLYVFVGALLFAGVCLRFPRAAGVPGLIVLTVVIVASVSVIREWYPVRGDSSLAVAHVLSADEDRYFADLEDNTPGQFHNDIVQVPGREIAPIVDVLEISDYLFFVGANRGLRLVALSPRIDQPPTLEQSWFAALVTDRVPLFTIHRESAASLRINLLRTYRLVGQPSGAAIRTEVAE